MATRSAILYQGEDMTPEIDYTDFVVWEESEFGTRAWRGEGNASSIVIRDPLGEQGSPADLPAGLTWRSLASKNLFVVKVGSDFLFRGRVGIKSYSRDGQQIERYRQVEVQLHDTNWDLDHIFVHNWARDNESDKARVQGLIASYLAADPRPTTALNGSNYISSSNLVTLPAHTYTQSSPLSILREISQSANKQFFVTGDAVTGGSLFYDGNDSTAYACTLSISDRASEVNHTTVFPPIWNVGPASTEDGSEQLDEVILFYGVAADQYVRVHDDNIHTQYGHSSGTFTDSTALTATEATRRANAILSHRKLEDRTYNVTIGPLTDAQVVLVKHGQTISIKARATTDADDSALTMRIVQCRYTTPVMGTWFAHLQLGRPWKLEPYGSGPSLLPQPPTGSCTDLTSTLAPEGFDAEDATNTHWVQGGSGGREESYLLSDAGDEEVFAHGGQWLFNTRSGDTNNNWIAYTFSGTWNAGTTYTIGFWIISNITGDFEVRMGHATASAPPSYDDGEVLTLTGPITDWTYHEIEWTPDSTYISDGEWDTTVGVRIMFDARGYPNLGIAMDDGTVMACSGAESPISIGGPGEGTIGDGTPVTVPTGTIIEHGDLSGKGGIMHDASQIEYDNATSGLTATDVQDAIDELADGSAATTQRTFAYFMG